MKNGLINKINGFFTTWKNLISLSNLSYKKNIIIFYAEISSDWIYLDSIIHELDVDKNIIRITSDVNDNLILNKKTYYLGNGSALTYFFRTIKFKAVVMTLTDLQTYHLKKSIYPVHYFYVFHSLVSTHRAYKEKAFDAYDTILCSGQHHINEIKKNEKIYNLKSKNLCKHGYGRLDILINNYKNKLDVTTKVNKSTVLIAPTWGKSSIFGKTLDNLIEILIYSNIKTILRLHPMTKRQDKKNIDALLKKYISNDNFEYNEDIEGIEDIINSDVMISDWSGASMEYAFTTEKPLIFIDTKPKIRNLNWKKLNLPCIEESVRKDIGKIIAQKDLEKIPLIIKELINDKNLWSDKIKKIRDKSVFNIGNSGKVGAEIINKTLNN